MTREEAIKTIESAKRFTYDGIYDEAFDMAISALSESKCFDGMTNKEVIEVLFPGIELGEIHNGRHRFFLKGKESSTFDLKAEVKWLNAPYQKGGE